MPNRLEYRRWYHREYRKKNRDRILAAEKEYRERNKDNFRAYFKKWYDKNKDRLNQQRREYNREHPERKRESAAKYQQRLKIEVLTHYGNNRLACMKCGNTDIRVLSIDHISGGGGKHLRGLRGIRIYHWLIQQSYPVGYQTLCMNCQFIKRRENKEYGRTL